MTRFFSFSNQIEIQLLFHIDYWWTVESKYNCFKCYYILNLMWGQWKNGQWSFGILWRNTTFYMECRVSRYKWEGGKEKGAKKASALIGMDGGLDLTVRQTHTRPLNDQKSDAKMHFASHTWVWEKFETQKVILCVSYDSTITFSSIDIFMNPLKFSFHINCFISEFKLFLLLKGASIVAEDNKLWHPLHYAARNTF